MYLPPAVLLSGPCKNRFTYLPQYIFKALWINAFYKSIHPLPINTICNYGRCLLQPTADFDFEDLRIYFFYLLVKIWDKYAHHFKNDAEYGELSSPLSTPLLLLASPQVEEGVIVYLQMDFFSIVTLHFTLPISCVSSRGVIMSTGKRNVYETLHCFSCISAVLVTLWYMISLYLVISCT